MKPKISHTAKTKGNNLSGGDWHANHSSLGMGDYYGTGIKAKLGTVKDGLGMVKLSKKKLGTAPKNLA